MHADGFRFDLAPTLARQEGGYSKVAAFLDMAAQDPVVSRAKLVAEPWDVGQIDRSADGGPDQRLPGHAPSRARPEGPHGTGLA